MAGQCIPGGRKSAYGTNARQKEIEMRRQTIFKLLGMVIMLGLLVSACGPATPEALPEEAPTSQPEEEAAPAEEAEAPPEQEAEAAAPSAGENVAVYASMTSIPDIDPAISFSDDSIITSNAYETLVLYNPPGSEELLSPALATSWEPNDDATEWTFHLREGVKFHDGTDFTAEAVKYSIERTMEMALGASYIWDPVEEIEVVDDTTVIFRLSYPAPLDLIASAGYGAWIMSPTCGQAHDTEWLNEGNDCGSGPYMVDSRERGQRMIMSRFDDYWGGWQEGQFDRLVFNVVEDPVVRQQMIEAGEADFTLLLPRENLAALDARDDVTVHTNASFMNLLGLLNHRKPPLDDPLVRQAISYAFPYDDLIDNVLMGYAVQAHGPVPVGMWGHGEDLFQYEYDLEKAKDLLEQAGYPDGGFDLLLTHATGDLDEAQVAELWKAELAKLGINLEIQAMSWEPQWELAMSDPTTAQDIFLFYWWPDYVSPYSFLFAMFHCEEEPLFNLGYVCDPDVDALMDQANELAGSDRAESERLFVESQKLLVENADATYFYDVSNSYAIRSDVKGYVDNPAYPHVVFFYNLSR
jgi:peptide/nickel transport system substrate-binding protein